MAKYYQANLVRVKDRRAYNDAVLAGESGSDYLINLGTLIFTRSLLGTYREALTRKKVGSFGRCTAVIDVPETFPRFVDYVAFCEAKDNPFFVNEDEASRIKPEFAEEVLSDYNIQVNGKEGITAFFDRIQKEYEEEKALEESSLELTLKPKNE
jgi:hypothetical protein